MTLRAAAYARVSSAGQRDRHTIESQLRVLPEYIRAQGWQLAGTYVDDGRSARAGRLDQRDGFARLMVDAEARLFDLIVVVDIDRLTRSDDAIERATILGPFQRLGIDIVTPAAGRMDLRTLLGELYVTMQSLFAAEENRKRVERSKSGKLTAISKGRKHSGSTPYGYRHDRETGWTIHEPDAAIIREVFARTLRGESGASIAADLRDRGLRRPRGGEWSTFRVYQLLKCTTYRGEWQADKRRRMTVAVPPIVDAATWYAVRDRGRAVRLRGRSKSKHVHLLAGLAQCALCGAPIRIASATSTMPARYVCDRRRHADRGERCTLPYLTVSEIDARLWAGLAQLINAPGRIDRVAELARADAEREAGTWRADLESADQRLKRLVTAQAGLASRFALGELAASAFDTANEANRRAQAQAARDIEAANGARFAAGREETRAQALATMLVDLRARAAEPSPAARRTLVVELLRPGSVRLSIAEIEFDLAISRAGTQFGGSSGIFSSNSAVLDTWKGVA